MTGGAAVACAAAIALTVAMRAPQQPGGPIPQSFGPPATGRGCPNEISLRVGDAIPHSHGRRVRDIGDLAYYREATVDEARGARDLETAGWLYRDDRGGSWFGPAPHVSWRRPTVSGASLGTLVARSLQIRPPAALPVRVVARGTRLAPHLALLRCFSMGASLLP